MRQLPPEKELRKIEDTLKKGERRALWLALSALCLFLACVVVYGNDLRNDNAIKKKSPKLSLQANIIEY